LSIHFQAGVKSIIRILVLLLCCVLTIWVVVARPFTTSSPGEAHDINSALLKERVRLISQDFAPRDSEHPEILNELSQYIFDEFSLHSSDVEFQNFTARRERFRNVVAKFGPDSGKVLVIGAHYDSYDDLPGADDNASGVVGLIELSRLLASVELEVPVHLVAYSLEEPPFFASKKMGSYIHASELKNAKIDIELMISLEMIGYYSDEANSQSYPIPLLNLLYPTTGNFIAVVDRLADNNALGVKAAINQHTNIDAYSINAPAYLTGVDFSDHRNYWQFDYPAVMVTNTASYRNKAYHTEFDTYDKLNYEKMAEVIYGVFKFVQSAKPDVN